MKEGNKKADFFLDYIVINLKIALENKLTIII